MSSGATVDRISHWAVHPCLAQLTKISCVRCQLGPSLAYAASGLALDREIAALLLSVPSPSSSSPASSARLHHRPPPIPRPAAPPLGRRLTLYPGVPVNPSSNPVNPNPNAGQLSPEIPSPSPTAVVARRCWRRTVVISNLAMEDNNDELLDEQNEAIQARVSLPQDVQQIILASLPGRVVLKFRRVCKFWRDCIEEPTFVDRHLNSALRFHQSIACFTSVDHGLVQMYTFDPTTMNFKSMELVFSCRFNMSGPCNGLVCAYDLKGDVEVLNPTTRKHLGLPVSELVSQAPFSEYFVGFVHSTKEYKVVSVRHHLQFLTFEVCTIGTLSWRTVRESADLLKTTKAVIVNDGVYWLLLDEISSDLTRKILWFSLTDENFSTIAVPNTVKDRDLELFEGEGKLHLLSMHCKGSAYTASEIWVAGSTRQVWVHMYTVAPQLPLGVRPFFLHKRKLFFGNEKRFTYIDLVDGSVFYINMPFGESLISCGMFVESFIPSMTGLVNSTTLSYSSHRAGSSSTGPGPSSRGAGSSSTGPGPSYGGAGSSSTGRGHSSGLTGWSSAELVQSSKRAKKSMNMEWKIYSKDTKLGLVYE